VLSVLGHVQVFVQVFFIVGACAGQCARPRRATQACAPPEHHQSSVLQGAIDTSPSATLRRAARAQAHTPLVSPTKRSSDQRSVDIMLSAATQSESVVLQRKLTGGSSAPSTPSLLETTLSRQMSSFKLDWQARAAPARALRLGGGWQGKARVAKHWGRARGLLPDRLAGDPAAWAGPRVQAARVACCRAHSNAGLRMSPSLGRQLLFRR